MLAQAAAWRARGIDVALATVISAWGSAPRPAGSQLAVNARGEFVGSVSSGCVENAVLEEARGLMSSGGLRRLRFGVSNGMAWEVGLACGGEIEVMVEGPVDAERLAALQRAREAKRPVVLATDLESGEQWLLDPDASASQALHPALFEEARERLRSDRAGRALHGGREYFLNVYNPPHRMIVVGAVHIAQALVPMARLAGFETVLVDPRGAFASEERFPDTEIVREWPDPALSVLGLDSRCAVVTLSHDPKLDDPALVAALRSEAYYVGALGSRKTHAARLERLGREGFAASDLARIHGPVGLAIGSRTPAEIAVSVVAQAVSALRQGA